MGEIIRKMKNGKFVGWYLRYVDADGRRKQRASKQPSFAEARRMLIEIEARIARGLVGMAERSRPEPLTLDALCSRFVDLHSDPRVKDRRAYQVRVRKLLRRVTLHAPDVAQKELSQLGPAAFQKLRDGLLTRYPAGTVRTTLSSVAAALSWAVREGMIKENPAKGAKLPPAPLQRIDFLTADEVTRLLSEAEQRARTQKRSKLWWVRFVAVSLAVRLGLRKGEVFGLRWQDIDLDAQRLTVARSYATTPKSGKPRHLRVPKALVPLLREWQKLCPHPDLVCPLYRSTERRWAMAVNSNRQHGLPQLLGAAGCRVLDRPWHMLRHTFASHFVMSGGNLLALSQILGHSDVKITMVYAHLSSDFLADQMDKVKF
ncbi:MAG TPA: site-specific integrase [Pseudomonadota bacterium]|nr:site-specific integrase [Pseudomonadota bacterium]